MAPWGSPFLTLMDARTMNFNNSGPSSNNDRSEGEPGPKQAEANAGRIEYTPQAFRMRDKVLKLKDRRLVENALLEGAKTGKPTGFRDYRGCDFRWLQIGQYTFYYTLLDTVVRVSRLERAPDDGDDDPGTRWKRVAVAVLTILNKLGLLPSFGRREGADSDPFAKACGRERSPRVFSERLLEVHRLEALVPVRSRTRDGSLGNMWTNRRDEIAIADDGKAIELICLRKRRRGSTDVLATLLELRAPYPLDTAVGILVGASDLPSLRASRKWFGRSRRASELVSWLVPTRSSKLDQTGLAMPGDRLVSGDESRHAAR